MVVGEARFHTCLEAEAADVGLLLPGHFASERFAMECLAEESGRSSRMFKFGPAGKNAIRCAGVNRTEFIRSVFQQRNDLLGARGTEEVVDKTLFILL